MVPIHDCPGNTAASPPSPAGSPAETVQFVRQTGEFFNARKILELDWPVGDTVCLTRHSLAVSGQVASVSQTATVSAALPLADAAFDFIFNFTSLDRLDDETLARWLNELYRVSGAALWLVVETRPERPRAWWEQRLFEAGFRKHPLGMGIQSPADLQAQAGRLTLIFEKVPVAALAEYPLAVLARERNLHMDMLRESGPRSDAHLARYQLAAQQARDGDAIVDVACGLGYGSALLARQFPQATVIGVDNSEFAINYARANFAVNLPNLEFHCADVASPGWLAGRKVNLLVSFETIEHIPDPDGFLRLMTQNMPPDARFIGSVPNMWVDETGKDPNPFHLHVFDLNKFRQLVGGHFKLSQIVRQNAERGVKGDQGRILRAIPDGQPTPDDECHAERWLLVGKGLVQPVAPVTAAEKEFTFQLAQFFGSKKILLLDWLDDQSVRFAPQHFDSVEVPPTKVSTGPASPRLPVKDGMFDTVVNLASLAGVSPAALPGWLTELHRITERNLWVALEALNPRNHAWWEAQFAAAGFGAHPRLPELQPEAPPADGLGPVTFILEKIATAPALQKAATVATPVKTICLATNYLLMTPATRQMWADLGQHLDECGCQLVLLSTTTPESPLPFPVHQHPYLMRDFAAAFPDVAAKVGVAATPRDLEWLQADISRMPGGYPLSETLVGLAAFRAYFRELLRTLQPGFMILADNTLCQTALLQKICLDAGITVQIYERGLLPETLMLESRGIQAWSDMRTHWLAQDWPASAQDAAAYERIRAYYLTRRPQKYAQADFGGGGADVRRQLGLEGKKVVVFLGGGYEANGHAPKGGIYERHFYTGFPTTESALMALWREVEKMPGTALVFKAHPLDPQTYSVAKIEGVHVVRDINAHALIDAADVVAAQYTTLQFEAVLYDKPVLTLARSAWWGRNAAYEVESPEDLPGKLAAALQRCDWPTHEANARAFDTWMMDQVLVGCSAEVPTRRNLRDLAKFISRTAVTACGLPSPEARCQQAREALDQIHMLKS